VKIVNNILTRKDFELVKKGNNNTTKYNIDDFYNFITDKLSKKNISYETEENTDLKTLWFDRENNFCCRIYNIGADVCLLRGSASFNLCEGKEADLLTIDDMVKHILKITSNELFQEEIYKKNKLCSVRQFIIIDGKKIYCSSFAITHIFFFLPFCKKEIKIVTYKYQHTFPYPQNCY
jgi:hypothetical protein